MYVCVGRGFIMTTVAIVTMLSNVFACPTRSVSSICLDLIEASLLATAAWSRGRAAGKSRKKLQAAGWSNSWQAVCHCLQH